MEKYNLKTSNNIEDITCKKCLMLLEKIFSDKLQTIKDVQREIG